MIATRTTCIAAVPWLAHSRGPEVVGAITTLTILATIAVVLRFLARKVACTSYGVDDWLILFTLVWEYGLSISQLLAVHYGFGRHLLLLDPDQITKFSKLVVACTLIFPVACAALKFSVLFFYHRIFPVQKFAIWNIGIGVVVFAWFIAFIVSQFLTCRPLAYNWDKTIAGGRCINSNHVAYYITSPPDIATNIAILVLPIPWLWNLQMHLRKKIALTIIFLLDTIVNAGIWLNVEISIGILSASLPLLRPLFTRAFRSQIHSRITRSRNTGSQRLHDTNPSKPTDSNLKNGTHARIRSLQRSGDVYSGESLGTGGVNRSNRDWYTAAVAAKKGSHAKTGTSDEGSQEDMVPMGKIQVRHDVEWEQERRDMGAKEGEEVGTFLPR
ncbi:MAG: hypothetical protein Q9181_008000 [Wetmoreana brouardii]